MKKTFVIIVALCLFAVAPAAAQLDWGIKAGVNMAEKPSNIGDVKNKTGWFVGPTAKVMLPIVGLGVEANILYSRAESEMQGKNVTKQSIDVPVFLRYELSLPIVNKFIEPFVAAGPQWSWNVGDKEFKLLDESSYKVKESTLSLNLGAGVILFDHVQVHANYNIALGNTSDYSNNAIDGAFGYLTNKSSKTNTWQFSVAYMF